MWGTSSPEDKLAGDLGNVIGATSIGGRRSDFFTARNGIGPMLLDEKFTPAEILQLFQEAGLAITRESTPKMMGRARGFELRITRSS